VNTAAAVAPQDLDWFSTHAEALDRGTASADALLGELSRRGLLHIGVPAGQGGAGGTVADAAEAVARVAERSLAAALVFWGHRTLIECLLQSPNADLRARWLPSLLAGELAGASGLSNAMKYLADIESLRITASAHGDRWRLHGRVPWATNLRPGGFVVAVAVDGADGGAPPKVVALTDELPGIHRSEDLDLIALRGTHTARIDIDRAEVGAADVIHDDARAFCPRLRPAFLSLQLGLSIGLARASLEQARSLSRQGPGDVESRVDALWMESHALALSLREGLQDGRFVAQAQSLFRIRIRYAEIVQAALNLELEAAGGQAYLVSPVQGFARRWREAAFIPVITPSLAQLRFELRRAGGPAPAA